MRESLIRNHLHIGTEGTLANMLLCAQAGTDNAHTYDLALGRCEGTQILRKDGKPRCGETCLTEEMAAIVHGVSFGCVKMAYGLQ